MNKLISVLGWGLAIIGSAQFLTVGAILNYQRLRNQDLPAGAKIDPPLGLALLIILLSSIIAFVALTYGAVLIRRNNLHKLPVERK